MHKGIQIALADNSLAIIYIFTVCITGFPQKIDCPVNKTMVLSVGKQPHGIIAQFLTLSGLQAENLTILLSYNQLETLYKHHIIFTKDQHHIH